MSRPESVSSRIASVGSRIAIWKISLRFFSPPEKPSLTGALDELLVDVHELRLLLDEREEVERVELGQPAVLADGVQRGLQEVDVRDARDLDRVLEREEDAFAGAHLGRHGEEVAALVEDLALSDLVSGPSGEDVGERALARAVRAHDRVDLARVHREVDAAEDLVASDVRVEVLDLRESIVIRRFLRG